MKFFTRGELLSESLPLLLTLIEFLFLLKMFMMCRIFCFSKILAKECHFIFHIGHTTFRYTSEKYVVLYTGQKMPQAELLYTKKLEYIKYANRSTSEKGK